MQRTDVFWLQRPDDDEAGNDFATDYRAMRFRLTTERVAVDADQLLLDVAIEWRTGDDGILEELGGQTGILKQYGGERLLNDLLLADADPTKGTEWLLEYYPASGFTITHSTDWEPPVDWLAAALDDRDDDDD